MTRMTGPDCVVMCNLINTYIHTYIHSYIYDIMVKKARGRRITWRSHKAHPTAAEVNKILYVLCPHGPALMSAEEQSL